MAMTDLSTSVRLLLLTGLVVTAVQARSLQKRADDSDPLSGVVAHLTAQVSQMQAQVQANSNTLDTVKEAVGFTVRTVEQDVHGLGQGQTIKFDNVLFNAGGGYAPSTGLFMAPASGTYVFFLQTLRHGHTETKVYLDVMKNGNLLARVHAGYSEYENGSSLAVTHLDQGDEVHVQVSVGSSFTGGPYTTFAGFRVSAQ